MDREKAQEILKAYGRPSFKVGENNIVFARQTEENLSEIESTTKENLQKLLYVPMGLKNLEVH